jgi:hypothetical protein
MRVEIPSIVADPAEEFSDTTELAGWQQLYEDIVTRLPALEADCPTGDDPPPPLTLRAHRTLLG